MDFRAKSGHQNLIELVWHCHILSPFLPHTQALFCIRCPFAERGILFLGQVKYMVGHQTARIFQNWSSNTKYFYFDDQTPLLKYMFGHQTARIFQNWSSNTKYFYFDDQTLLLKYMFGHQTARIFQNWSSNTNYFNFDDQTLLLMYMFG